MTRVLSGTLPFDTFMSKWLRNMGISDDCRSECVRIVGAAHRTAVLVNDDLVLERSSEISPFERGLSVEP